MVRSGVTAPDEWAADDETALLEAWRAGQTVAFEALFRHHYADVHRLLYRLVGDQADDLAQEVFLRLYHRPPRRAEHGLAPWLRRVALNLGYNTLRAEERQRRYRDRLGALTGGLGWTRDASRPEEAAERSAEEALVRRALARLDRRAASMLVLRHSGASYREVAGAVGVAPGSVGTLLARAERAFERAYRELAGGAE